MCIAENEETSPWPPYHTDLGFAPEDSAVTVVTVTGPTDILDSGSRNHRDTLENIAAMMFYRHSGGGGWIHGRQSAQVGHSSKRVPYQGPYHPIMLSPSRAVILANAGMSKRDAQEWLHQRCRVSLREAIGSRPMPTDDAGRWRHYPELQPLAEDPGRHHTGAGNAGAVPAVRDRRLNPLRQLFLRHLRDGNDAR